MPRRLILTFALIVGLPLLVWFAGSQSTPLRSVAKTNPSSAPSMPSKEAVSAKLATLERGWVKNEGQWNQRALFSAPGYFGTTWVTKDGELLHVAVKKEECKDKTEKGKTCPTKSWVISERWVDGKVQAINGEEELGTKVNYFIGNDPSNHKSGLSTYRYVSLGEVWSGVEVKLKATQKTVERLFYVKPGVDPSKIQVQLNGAKGLKLSKDGEIIIKTGLGELKLSKPIAWQEKDGKKLPVEVSYKLIGKNRYSFEVAKADPSLPIVIDPILQSTYLGGSGDDYTIALAIHPTTGDVYVAGYTSSNNFPKTSGGAQASNNGGTDAFVAKLNSGLTQILQSTYLGGSGDDDVIALAIHPTTGGVYVAGRTASADFPRTSGGAQQTYGGGPFDAFVARLDSTLTNSSFQSTYLGGSNYDRANALAISSTGDVYVAGDTDSNDFPRTSVGAQVSRGGGDDAFVARLTADLAASASTYTLSINPTPTNGNVTSSPAGINCGSGGSTCSTSFTSGSTVILTATPDAGYTFAGWTGDCSTCGTNTTCTINMNTNKTCSANFTASGGGSGGGSGSGGGGGGCSMTGSASSMAGVWNILVWLLVPTYVLARRIKRMR